VNFTLWQALALGALQGATEFLPVSSSGHLVLVPALLGWPAPPLPFTVALHWGTVAAVLWYFRRDWLRLARGVWRAVRAGDLVDNPDGRLAVWMALATLPAAAVGLAFHDLFAGLFASPQAAARFLYGTAALLVVAELLARRRAAPASLGAGIAAAIGVAQAVSILPGISRSGATIAAGLGLGLPREEAARFSFLISTPVIVGAGLLELPALAAGGSLPAIGVGMVAAFAVGYASIAALLHLVRRQPLYGFAGYVAVFATFALWRLR
jgi:undecaprenyl-diphosphatase